MYIDIRIHLMPHALDLIFEIKLKYIIHILYMLY